MRCQDKRFQTGRTVDMVETILAWLLIGTYVVCLGGIAAFIVLMLRKITSNGKDK